MKTAVALALTLGVQASPVQKIVQLLGELKTKVQGDLDNETKAMDEYMKYCDDEITEKGFAIKTATKAIDGYDAAIEKAKAQTLEYDDVLQTSGAEIAAKEGELAEAVDVRKGEAEDFAAAEKELVDTVDTLARAITVLKRELSFAQGATNKGLNKKLGNLAVALSAVIDAAWVDPSVKSKVSAFLQDDDDDLSLVQQPQATTSNYESKSGGIVTALQEMKGKAEDSLDQLRNEEMKSKHSFAMVKQGLANTIKTTKEEVEEATTSKGEAAEVQAKAEGDLAATSKARAADEEYLANMKQECKSKSEEWEVRQKDAAAEMTALAKAEEVLSNGVKVALVQTSSHRSRVKSLDSRGRLVQLLRHLGRKTNSFALMQVANAATADPFVKVRGMVNEMISKLEKQAEEEATHEAFCQEETAKTKKARETKTERVDKYQVRLDKANAAIAELKNDIADLGSEISDITKSTQEATAMRQKENAEYRKASKDYEESVAAVAQAIQVLNEFYGGKAAFVQQPSFASSNSDSGNMIVAFLEDAEADFTRLLAEANASESESAAAFEKMEQENKISKLEKETMSKGKQSEVKSVENAIAQNTDDLATSNKELDAVLEYMEKLKPQCANKAMTYEERKAKREAEIAGLKSALDILAGDEPAALGLLQTKNFLRTVKAH